ncbi:hypothetical protein [Stenotrophomonas maltophilia]|uniref:hypothetical protein n=1 Tax=Stenotrophomonas maltophilia TaxID=40324 RepID=UPI004041D8A4
MRDYGKIHTGFWASETMLGLESDARLLAIYLMTSQHTTMLGAFRLPDAYACEDLGWSSERFQKGLETLSQAGFVKYDRVTKVVWIVKFVKWNRPDNPNQQKSIVKLAQALPDSLAFKDEILASIGVSETVAKPLGNSPVPAPVPVSTPEGMQGEVLAIPLADGSEYAVTDAELAGYRAAYPRIDVVGEIRKARAWAVANPANRKTRRGTPKFINGWLGRATERAPAQVLQLTPTQQAGGGRRAL